jgi:hypothetical protein
MTMRSLLSLGLAALVAGSALLVSRAPTADAAFHCIRIHAVMGGFNGDNDIQYVELRMDAGGQTLLGGHTIEFFRASDGMLRATFTFPAGVTNGLVGDSILVATHKFNLSVTGGQADFEFEGHTTGPDATHPVQLTGGTVVWAGPGPFACTFAGMPVDAVAYGGGSGGFGSSAAALPATGTTQALRLSNLNVTPSSNLMEYSLQNVSPSAFDATGHLVTNPVGDPPSAETPRNNGRRVLQLFSPVPPSVGGVAENPAGAQNAVTNSSGDGGGRGRIAYGLVAVIAASVAASGAGWYVYRRRIGARG